MANGPRPSLNPPLCFITTACMTPTPIQSLSKSRVTKFKSPVVKSSWAWSYSSNSKPTYVMEATYAARCRFYVPETFKHSRPIKPHDFGHVHRYVSGKNFFCKFLERVLPHLYQVREKPGFMPP